MVGVQLFSLRQNVECPHVRVKKPPAATEGLIKVLFVIKCVVQIKNKVRELKQFLRCDVCSYFRLVGKKCNAPRQVGK